MHIRMAHYISGGRADGRDWPQAGVLFEVPDAEAEDLIRGHLAVRAEAEELPLPQAPAPAADPEPHWAPNGELIPPQPQPAAAPEPAEPAAQEAAAEPETAASAPEEARPPRPGAARQTWVEYAVSQGADRDKASAMTKDELQSRYGGRL